MKLCKYCETRQPEEAFPISAVVAGKVYRRLRCQTCYQAQKRERRTALRCWLEEHKKGLACGQCGFADHRALEFHHEEPHGKDFNVADMIRAGMSRNRISQEIGKCAVLCSNCHRIAHADEWLSIQTFAAGPRHTKARGVTDTSGLTSELLGRLKVCRYCLVEQDESCFEVCKVLGSRVYRRHKCRACKQATQYRRKQKLRAWLEGHKKTLWCAECGFRDFRALEFHHPDDQEKDLAIGEMVKDNRSVAAIQREMARCVVLCANCHRITHYVEPARQQSVAYSTQA